MTRLPLLTDREDLDDAQRPVFDWIVGSRGRILRPFEVLLHAPGVARPAAELGHQIRFEGALSDHDRELAILTTAVARSCDFEWETHAPLARAAGVAETTLAALRNGQDPVSASDDVIVGFVRELCARARVSDATYNAARERLGTAGVVELSTLAGYYTMLAGVINLAEPEAPEPA